MSIPDSELAASRYWKRLTAASLTLDPEVAGEDDVQAALEALEEGGSEVASLVFIIDGGGSAIATGVKGDLGPLDYACTIQAASVLANESGSIVVDIWKDSYANFPPTDADSITASSPPTLSSATKSQDTTLTGWTTSIAVGDILRFNVDSATTVTRATIALKILKT